MDMPVAPCSATQTHLARHTTFDDFFGVEVESRPQAEVLDRRGSEWFAPLPSPIDSSESVAYAEQLPVRKDSDAGEARHALVSVSPTVGVGRFSHRGVELKLAKISGVGEFVVGAALARKLRKETYNMYRTLAVMGREVLRADNATLLPKLLQMRLVSIGTRSATLVGARDAIDYIDRIDNQVSSHTKATRRLSSDSEDSDGYEHTKLDSCERMRDEPPAYVILAGLYRVRQ